MSKNLDKMAAKDAENWARAEMFFGEGAGIRRKHLQADIDSKTATIPGYLERFTAFYESQDMAEHAIAAAKERKRIDAGLKASKNLRALKNGNTQNLSVGIFVVLGAYVVARETGVDKSIEAEAKKLWARGKREIATRKAARNERIRTEEGR